ncbi:MAG TPA: hypothetical protein VFJ16_24815 [Longimicrobium sp.]|nr:hypothetical protein [Longimicrobium sp.]
MTRDHEGHVVGSNPRLPRWEGMEFVALTVADWEPPLVAQDAAAAGLPAPAFPEGNEGDEDAAPPPVAKKPRAG